jgi:polynucleotide 5'-kinase involved in rRNA processing
MKTLGLFRRAVLNAVVTARANHSINLKMSSSTTEQQLLADVRKKPLIVICGCTGTGKTKLSVQLAEWLVASGRRAEIINADAMQVLFQQSRLYGRLFY